MFAFRNNQPEMSPDAEFFYESERARTVSAINSAQTVLSPDRPAVDIRDLANDMIEARDFESLVVQLRVTYNIVNDVVGSYAERTAVPEDKRPEDQQFVDTCRGLGAFLMHGSKVARWNKNGLREDITAPNIVAQALANIIKSDLGGSNRRVRRMARMLMNAS